MSALEDKKEEIAKRIIETKKTIDRKSLNPTESVGFKRIKKKAEKEFKADLKKLKDIEKREKKSSIGQDPPTKELKDEFNKWKGGFCALFGKIKDQTYDDLFAIWLFLYPNISVEDILSQPSTSKEEDEYIYKKLLGITPP
tara:strand:- start:572 stop:994 length:423 start_codon:yes stop_codon:yes gene_type:complete